MLFDVFVKLCTWHMDVCFPMNYYSRVYKDILWKKNIRERYIEKPDRLRSALICWKIFLIIPVNGILPQLLGV